MHPFFFIGNHSESVPLTDTRFDVVTERAYPMTESGTKAVNIL